MAGHKGSKQPLKLLCKLPWEHTTGSTVLGYMLMQVLSLMDTVPDTPPTPEEEEAFSKDPDTILARVVRDLFMDEDAAKTTLAVSASSLYMPSGPPRLPRHVKLSQPLS